MMTAKNKLSLYWKCQLIGWSVASLYWVLMGLIGTSFSVVLAIILFIGDLVIYITPTHVFRLISLKNKWEQLRPRKLLAVVLPAILIMGFVFMCLTIGKNYLVRYGLGLATETLGSAFTTSWLVTWMTGIRLASIWLLAYYLYHYAQAEWRASQESARLHLVAKNAQLENLKAQLNPHFFFNSLNTIKALISENPAHARRAIDLLSELLRTALYHRHTELISLKDEMALVADYLELEKMRYEEHLQVDLVIADDLLPTLILPLSIQTLVENAIKHGISRQPGGGVLSIRAVADSAVIAITVQNPGQLQPVVADGRLGLSNLKERLQLQYAGKAHFSIKQLDAHTVSCTLILPRK